MRKAGWITAIFGAVLSAALLLVLQSDWYRGQSTGAGSDFAEMAAASFWAALVMVGFGIVLVLVSLRQTDREPEIEKPAPLEVTWICPYCGGENTKADQVCCECGPGIPPPENGPATGAAPKTRRPKKPAPSATPLPRERWRPGTARPAAAGTRKPF